MNWLERARHEISKSIETRTVNSAIRKHESLEIEQAHSANTAERNLTAVMAVPKPEICEKSKFAANDAMAKLEECQTLYLGSVPAVPSPALRQKLEGSFGSNGSASPSPSLEIGLVRDEFEERAAILEFDGGLSRDGAEREASALVSKRYRLHGA